MYEMLLNALGEGEIDALCALAVEQVARALAADIMKGEADGAQSGLLLPGIDDEG